MLQNHPGEASFPVKPDWNAKVTLRLTDRERVAAHGMLTLAIITLGLAGIGGGVVSDLTEPFPAGWWFVGICAMLGAVCLSVMIFLLSRAATRRVKEQQRYCATAGISLPYPELYRQALQLDGVNAVGNWSETLENWPCERRAKTQRMPTFVSFSLLTVDEQKSSLDADWGILTRADYLRMVEALKQGLHTREFVRDAVGPQRDALFDRLSALTGIPSSEIASLLSSSATGGPNAIPALIWAWDWWRIFPMTRGAYIADLITEDEAWATLLQVSEWIHALFGDLASYHRNLRIGHAYWSNNFADVQARMKTLEAFEANANGLSIVGVPWTSRPSSVLPDHVTGGWMRLLEMDDAAAFDNDDEDSDLDADDRVLN
ncbi:DUF1266 domain-containing protein [Hydrogenophaga sp. 5NK40-0174]|uniref:DUF1266 domain-containing protein n=1 Tax=Hydrogenophaga sp. 5NK40-0174 TaxID=3127649 RepID=UPI00310428DA